MFMFMGMAVLLFTVRMEMLVLMVVRMFMIVGMLMFSFHDSLLCNRYVLNHACFIHL